MQQLWQDLRYAWRMMGRTPGFTAVALVVLALGLGANAAMFSVVYHVMLRPLPYRDPQKLVFVVQRWREGTGSSIVPLEANAVAESAHSFESVAITFPSTGCNLAGGSAPEYLPGATVSTSFFPTLGVAPVLGRDFLPTDAAAGGGSVAIISYAAWQRDFGGDPAAIGRAAQCNGRDLTIVGVLPRNFRYDNGAQIWTADRILNYLGEQGSNYEVMARLRAGVTPTAAQQELDSIFAGLKRDNPKRYPYNYSSGLGLVPYRQFSNEGFREPLLILFGAAGLILLIACANMAGLLLARSAARAHELAVRMAVGASRARIAAQLLTETLLLNLLGAAAGLALAFWVVGGLRAILPAHAAWFSSTSLDPASLSVNVPVMFFMLGVSLVSGIITGAIPALTAGGRDPQASLKEGEKGGGSGRGQHRSRKALVTAEVALSLTLLVGATLLIRSFVLLERVDLGLDPQNLQVAQLLLASKNYSTAQGTWNFQRSVIERLQQQPGVSGAATASSAPLVSGLNLGPLYAGSRQCPGGALDYRAISPGFFSTTRTPVLRGRAFQDSDSSTSGKVVIVNQSLARACWGQQDPVGQSVNLYAGSPKGTAAEVVGVVADIKDASLASFVELVGLPSPPIAYVPQAQISDKLTQVFYQDFGMFSAILVRTAKPMDVSAMVRSAVQSVDPQQPVVSVSPMSQLVTDWVSLSRLLMIVMGIFAGLAVLLTAVGLYGLLAYYVAQRRREIGIRMALGAARVDVLRMIVGEGMVLVSAGLAIGIAGSFAAAGILKSLVFGVKPTDPAAFVVAPLLLLVVALLATAAPARRAARVDPMLALRQE
ncbi:MAG: ABC transporter permease [Acidobacteria bacterium]|nr:ABC transporter permease [Acidobacteriota bacterium]